MSLNKSDKIKALFKLVQKRHKYVPPVQQQDVLEHLIYAAVLENATYEAADAAYAVLEHHYIDWNEIRVSTAQELADTLPMLPDPPSVGERIKRTLQAVFETYYMYDLEELRKKTISQASDVLRAIPACSRFMVDYTVQVGLGGHVIPLDEAAMRAFRLLGLTQVSKDRTREEVSGIERAVAKNQGVLFASLLHLFATPYYRTGEVDALRTLLKGIDVAVLKRDTTAPALQPRKVEPVRTFDKPPGPGLFAHSYDDEHGDDVVEEGAEVDFTEPKSFDAAYDGDVAGADEGESPGRKNDAPKKKPHEKKRAQPNAGTPEKSVKPDVAGNKSHETPKPPVAVQPEKKRTEKTSATPVSTPRTKESAKEKTNEKKAAEKESPGKKTIEKKTTEKKIAGKAMPTGKSVEKKISRASGEKTETRAGGPSPDKPSPAGKTGTAKPSGKGVPPRTSDKGKSAGKSADKSTKSSTGFLRGKKPK